jgi:hypothetical protein
MTDPQRHAPRGPLIKRDPMTASDPMTDGCCKATTRQGQRCKQPAIHGGTVCRYHGGAAPQVKAAAMERLRALQHPAIDRLARLTAQEEFPTVAYAASRDVLDRTLDKPQEQPVQVAAVVKVIHELPD